MKKIKTAFYKTACCMFLLTALSCAESSYTPPYIVSKPECVLGEIPDVQKFAGIHFMFYNATDKTVIKVAASCAVYDENGKSPFYEGNIVYGEFGGSLGPQQYAQLVLPIDSCITVIPETAYQTDHLTIYRIEYEDGTEWTDFYSSFSGGGSF